MPARTATSGAGTAGATRRSTSMTASDPSPTARVNQCIRPSWVTRCHSCSKKFPDPFGTPSILGTWPTMMVSASPTMNPLSTGSEIRFARNPSRSTPASTASRPVVRANVTVRAAYAPASPAAASPTAAAESAAVAAIGPTIRCREVPSAA
jgi:hypothetical protein